MNITKVADGYYTPSYTRTELTDDLHEMGGFHTDYQLLTEGSLQKICKKAGKKN